MTLATLNRCKPILGTIITDTVGSVEVNGTPVADFCEVDPGWFFTTRCDANGDPLDDDDPRCVFSGSEAEVLAHYSSD